MGGTRIFLELVCDHIRQTIGVCLICLGLLLTSCQQHSDVQFDPNRLKIVMVLRNVEMCVCDLAALLGVSESAASHQIRILRTMNLVKNRRDGQVLYYRLVDDHVRQLAQVARDHVLELAHGK